MTKEGIQQGAKRDKKNINQKTRTRSVAKVLAGIILDEIVLARDLPLGIVQAGIIQPRISSRST